MRQKDIITLENLKCRIDQSMGLKKADLVIKNANVLNVFTNEFYKTNLAIGKGYFLGVGDYEGEQEIDGTNKYIVPSFIDSHIHLESAIVSPSNFRDAVVPHGTCAVVSDPHEITNVAGVLGIDFMLDTTKDLDIDCYVMIPSCVPATKFDESGATLLSSDIIKLYGKDRVIGLAEFMNSFGIIHNDEECLKKCLETINRDLLIDGHAPNILGKNLNAYCSCDISTDHECSFFEEAIEKLKVGQYIEIREGTACHDLKGLIKLIEEPYYHRCLFSTDDKHPYDIINLGHIDHIIRLAIQNGADPIKCFKIASINAANHYNLKRIGAIAPGYKANFVILDDVDKVEINSCYLNGIKVSEKNECLEKYSKKENIDKSKYHSIYNSFNMKTMNENDFMFSDAFDKTKARVISLVPGGVLTEYFETELNKSAKEIGVDIEKDIVKLAVVERHKNTGHIGLALLHGYGMKCGAVASSVSHDSHNIIVVGTNAKDMAVATNTIKEQNGGLCIVRDGKVIKKLSFEIAGLMTHEDINYVSDTMEEMKEICYNDFGIDRTYDPFMTLAFISLPVIPDVKLTTLGLVDVVKQQIVDVLM